MKSQLKKIQENAGSYECLSLADDDVHELLDIVRQLTELLETAVCPNTQTRILKLYGCQNGTIVTEIGEPEPCLWCNIRRGGVI